MASNAADRVVERSHPTPTPIAMLIPPPPYRPVGGYVTEFVTELPLVSANRALMTDGDTLVAVALPSLRPVWKRPLKHGTLAMGRDLYLSGRSPDGRLYALDPKTGLVRWSLPRSGFESAMASDATTLYTSLENYTLSAIDLRTHRPRWTRRLSDKQAQDYVSGQIESLTLTDGTLLAFFDNVAIALNASDGRLLWKSEGHYHRSGQPLAVVGGTVWLDRAVASEGRDVRTGAVRWSNLSVDADDFSAVYGGGFVSVDSGRAVGVDPTNGKTLWTRRIGEDNVSIGGPRATRLGDVLFVYGSDRSLALDPRGNVRWTLGGTMTGLPLWSDGRNVVTWDGDRLLAYEPGARPSMPQQAVDRKIEARTLVGRFDLLDDDERIRLKALGDAAFPPLLSALRRKSAVVDAVPEATRYQHERESDRLADALAAVTQPEHVPQLIAVLQKSRPDGNVRHHLLESIVRFSKPKVAIPLLVAELRLPQGERRAQNLALEKAVHSSHPAAVGYFIKALNSPEVPAQHRIEAFRHLAGTGGAAGLRAVLAHRVVRYRRPGIGAMRALEVGNDPRTGTTWGLFDSPHDAGLWIAEKRGDAWQSPHLLSLWTEGKPTLAPFLAKPTFGADGDGDGLFDDEETLLGTDPKNADTDGDGKPDAMDPCPDAARPSTTDDEKAIAAGVAALAFEDPSPGPVRLDLPKGMKPFEIVGRAGPLVYNAKAWVTSWHLTDKQMNRNPVKPIVWNATHTEATLTLVDRYGGWRTRVRRFGKDWVVVDMDMSFIF